MLEQRSVKVVEDTNRSSTYVIRRDHQAPVLPGTSVGGMLPHGLQDVVPILSPSESDDDLLESELGVVMQDLEERVDPLVERGRGRVGSVGRVTGQLEGLLLLLLSESDRGEDGRGGEQGDGKNAAERDHGVVGVYRASVIRGVVGEI
jgi:hypothetical protein